MTFKVHSRYDHKNPPCSKSSQLHAMVRLTSQHPSLLLLQQPYLHLQVRLEVLIDHVLLDGLQCPVPAVVVERQQLLRVLDPHAVVTAAHAAVGGGGRGPLVRAPGRGGRAGLRVRAPGWGTQRQGGGRIGSRAEATEAPAVRLPALWMLFGTSVHFVFHVNRMQDAELKRKQEVNTF